MRMLPCLLVLVVCQAANAQKNLLRPAENPVFEKDWQNCACE